MNDDDDVKIVVFGMQLLWSKPGGRKRQLALEVVVRNSSTSDREGTNNISIFDLKIGGTFIFYVDTIGRILRAVMSDISLNTRDDCAAVWPMHRRRRRRRRLRHQRRRGRGRRIAVVVQVVTLIVVFLFHLRLRRRRRLLHNLRKRAGRGGAPKSAILRSPSSSSGIAGSSAATGFQVVNVRGRVRHVRFYLFT